MRGLIAFASAVTLVSGQPQTELLVGRWRSTEVSPAGVAAVFEFRRDHQLDAYTSVISEEKYKVVGTDTILLQPPDGREVKQELEWDSPDRARIEDEPAGKSIELVRAGKSKDSRNPIAGEWKTKLKWKGRTYPARALFLAGGKVLWITDLRADHGRYFVNQGSIRIEIPNRPKLEGTFGLTGIRLTLPNPRGEQSGFELF